MQEEHISQMLENSEIRALVDHLFFTDFKRRQAHRLNLFRHLNTFAVKGQIVFAGSSLMEDFPVHEMQQHHGFSRIIYNRGIGGYVSQDLIDGLDACILDLEPGMLFINIGTNDLNQPGYAPEGLLERYHLILNTVRNELPECRIFTMAYYPVNPVHAFPGVTEAQRHAMFGTRTNAALEEASAAVGQLSRSLGCEHINVNDGLTDAEGNLRSDLSLEGMHMWPDAYARIFGNLKHLL